MSRPRRAWARNLREPAAARPGPGRPGQLRSVAAVLLAVLAVLALVTSSATGAAPRTRIRSPHGGAAHRGTVTFPVHETFDSATNSGKTSGAVTFDSGWMRLTRASASQTGSWVMTDGFPADLGIIAEFQYATWGGTSFDGKRGDGMAFFLADGSAVNGVGALGGALGYACSGSSTTCTTNGVPGAFLGVGLDEFGNFSSSTIGNGGPGSAANTIVLRGGGDKTTGYRYGKGVAGPGGSVETGSRDKLRTIRISIRPSGGKVLFSLWSDSGPGTSLTQLITDFDVTTITSQPKLPATLKVGFSAGTGGATNNHEIADLTINVPANLSVTMAGSPATVRAGADPVTYTVTVSNDATNDVTGALVRVTVPALTGVTWRCTASTGSSCAAASGSGAPDTTANLKRSGTATYTVTGTAPPSPTTITATATVTAPADRVDTNSADNSATAVTRVTAGPADIATAKVSLGQGPVIPGQTFAYRITTSNLGPADTTNVTMTDLLPSPLLHVSSSPTCAVSGRTVTCGPVASLKVAEAASWTVTVRLDPAYTGNGGDVLNTATSSSDAVDPAPGNNTSAAVGPPGGTAAAQADLSAAKKTATSTPVGPGETFAYQVAVSNAGPSQAANVKATDALPAMLSFVSSTDGCSATGSSVTCAATDPLAPGAAKTWAFTVRLDPAYQGDGSDIRNTATAVSTTQDPDPANNTSPPAGPPGGTVSSSQADLGVGKTIP
ncbi:hypothetical protein CFP65_6972 [Kitasatospora sp. MMS16-BH015]|uniref:lectin-like domain-containing protein n=1 Tax=Kitasatospora sp. MMS16-BH015 TaxID=2018025 RepID=UPI000CA3D2F8|nr:DUF11 domain-containing protein [Kitasatospora sp. MMS16-BH015]AUG81584.1 hypothetical protein CFP65_6972 [Kitasatospora sp. MMS16-BH015]